VMLLLDSAGCVLLNAAVAASDENLGGTSLSASINIGSYILFVACSLTFVVLLVGFVVSMYKGTSIILILIRYVAHERGFNAIPVPLAPPGAEKEQQACVIAGRIEAADKQNKTSESAYALDNALTAINPMHHMRASPRRALSTAELHHTCAPAESVLHGQTMHDSFENTASFRHLTSSESKVRRASRLYGNEVDAIFC
jgi:hypothetical protein